METLSQGNLFKVDIACFRSVIKHNCLAYLDFNLNGFLKDAFAKF